MPDAWTLITPGGPYQLNPSFTAPQYEPGGIAGPGALRRDDRTAYQRSGDGLRTPGALTLVGRVWRDDHNHALMVSELNAIRAAVSACTSVTRTNNAGTYTYDHLAGGATPEITPDGLGGWMVRLDLWPGRAEPTFVPAGGGGGNVDVLAASVVGLDSGPGTILFNIPDAPAPAGALLLLVLASENVSGLITDAPGLTNANGQPNHDPIHSDAVRIWAFTRLLPAPQSTVEVTTNDWVWGTAHITVMTGASGVADIQAASSDSNPSLGITGTSAEAGLQLFMGALYEYGGIIG